MAGREPFIVAFECAVFVLEILPERDRSRDCLRRAGDLSESDMGMTDPIADMLTRIRNASRARHESVQVPWSRIKEAITRVLVEEGYLQEVKRVRAKNRAGEELRITLRFDKANKPVISGLRRVSRPSLRVYVRAKEIAPIRKGLGISILSTPKGILVDRQAQKAKMGGELICSVW